MKNLFCNKSVHSRWTRALVFGLSVAASPLASAAVSGLTATNDASNAYYQYNYTGTPTYFQLFFDTDRNATSGYRTNGVGANLMIENSALYRYTGTGTNWSWSRVQSLTMTKTSSLVKWSVARSALGSPSSLNLVGRTNPPLSASGIVTQTFQSATVVPTPQASSDATNVSYQFKYSGTPQFFRIYLDTDRTTTTGYSTGGVGANFLIENGTLFRYSGSGGTNWGWSPVQSSGYSNSSGTAKWTLLRASLGSPAAIDLIGQVEAPLVTSAKVSQTLSSEPAPSPQPAPAPAPAPAPQPTPAPAPAPAPTPTPSPVSSVSYAPSSAVISNPERGFYWQSACDTYPFGASHFNEFKAGGTSVVRCVYYLRNFKTTTISQAYLDNFQRQMDSLRTYGFKVILRFAYTENTAGDDASVSRVMAHIDQLAPYLVKNSDVIAYLEAGFIGAWGEWAYSQNFGTPPNLTTQNWTDRKSVADKLLAVLPSNRSIQLRTPAFKMRLYGNTTLSTTEAFSGSARARVGHLNDCFLASDNDWGTYSNKTVEYPYLQEETKYTPMGGETCNPNPPRSSCPTAKSELAMFHWSNLHEGYHQSVISAWKSEGCYNEIKNKLGYRFVLQNGSYSTSAKLGGAVQVNFNVANRGYASPFNSRPLQLVFRNTSNGSVFRAALSSDPRRWLPGQTVNVSQTVTLPSGMPAGNYELLLAMPDSAGTLANRPEYAIQFANTNMWESSTGMNKLNHIVAISQ